MSLSSVNSEASGASGFSGLIAATISGAGLPLPSESATAFPGLLSAATVAGASSAGWIDGVGLALVLLFSGLGALRGWWWQIVRLCGVVAAFAVARALAPRISPNLQEWFQDLSPRLASGLAWTVVLMAGMLAVALVGRIGKSALDAADLTTFDRLGGVLAGALSGLFVHTALVVAAVQVAPRDFKAESIDGTHSQAWVRALDRTVPNLLDHEARQALETDFWRF